MNLYRHSSPPHPNLQRGFTLVELLVTISVVAILIALAMPNFSETARTWRRDSATKALVTDLKLARSEALKSSRKVSVCVSSSGTACATTTDWKVGWLVFVDRNNNSAPDSGEIIAVQGARDGVESMKDNSNAVKLEFLPNGLMGSAAAVISVKATGASSATKTNVITINRVGRTTLTQS